MIFDCYFFLITVFRHTKMSLGTHWHPVQICKINEIHLEISQTFPHLLFRSPMIKLVCATPFLCSYILIMC